MPLLGLGGQVLPLALYLLGALVAGLFHRSPSAARIAGYGAATLAGLVGVVLSLRVLAGASIAPVEVFTAAPYLPVTLGLDPLAAWFSLVLSGVGAATSVAALGYARGYDHHGGARLAALFNLFLGTMLLVLFAQSVFAFLVAWEAMSLCSYLLVVHDDEQRSVRRAGFVYLVMTHVGTGFLLLAFLSLAGVGGGLSFLDLRVSGQSLTPTVRSLVFLAGLVGFGTKAGLVPLHVWLPRAHPVAPSHVSALMSGVMLKVALYGFIRLTFDLLSGGPAWWGELVLLVGIVSAVLGVIYALMQHDLKTLLAYHSVENVGIIVLGLGAALLLESWGQPTLAALALGAALFHTLNHAVFKALLFLGAGAIDQATGTKDLERLGGLIRRMPQTALLFLVGAAAISALPPLNGFASEWLTFQALLGLGTHAPGVAFALGAAILAGLLALTGALAAACFVKAFGVAFLALPRSPEAAAAQEAPILLRLGMAPLALACVGLGLGPGYALARLTTVTTSLLGATAPVAPLGALVVPGATTLMPVGALGALCFLAALPVLAWRLLGTVPRRRGPTWVCGWDLEPSMQYGATSFAKPIRLFFRAIVRPQRVVERTYSQEPYFVSRLSYHGSITPVFERHLYGPI
ncbi:MAG TPA: proton-conducting transporter membrane subunit, partial [Chloroflexota bacterium]|nr:proton-conducting transporter membrane subunit [Chloroflexota bacterium]